MRRRALSPVNVVLVLMLAAVAPQQAFEPPAGRAGVPAARLVRGGVEAPVHEAPRRAAAGGPWTWRPASAGTKATGRTSGRTGSDRARTAPVEPVHASESCPPVAAATLSR